MPEESEQISPAAAPGRPQQAPMGVSSVTGPTPNRGYEAAALQQLGSILQRLTQIQPMVGVTSDIGKVVHKMIGDLAKIVPDGINNPASERNQLQQAMMQNQQQMAQAQQMGRPQAGGGAQPGGPPQLPTMRAA